MLADTAAEFNLDPQVLFSKILDLEQVRSHQYTPSWRDSLRLMECLVDAAGNKPIALEFGKRWTLSSYGTLGILICSMPNLATLFSFADEITSLIGLEPPYELQRQANESRLLIRLSSWKVSQAVERFVAESLLVSYMQTARMLLGQTIPILSVAFRHASPDYANDLIALFDCPVAFNQPHNEARFASSAMQLPFQTHNPHIAKSGMEACRNMLKELRRSDTISEQVRIELGKTPGVYPDKSTMAKRFCLESRTFSRRLQNEDLSYSDLVVEAKAAYAKQLLAETDLSTAEIAAKIGYSDEANFRRAFKLWVGTTPAEFRNSGNA